MAKPAWEMLTPSEMDAATEECREALCHVEQALSGISSYAHPRDTAPKLARIAKALDRIADRIKLNTVQD